MLASATAVPPTLTSLIVPTGISLAAAARTNAIAASPEIDASIVPVAAPSQKTQQRFPKWNSDLSIQLRIFDILSYSALSANSVVNLFDCAATAALVVCRPAQRARVTLFAGIAHDSFPAARPTVIFDFRTRSRRVSHVARLRRASRARRPLLSVLRLCRFPAARAPFQAIMNPA